MATIKDVMNYLEKNSERIFENMAFASKRQQLLEQIATDEGLYDTSSDSFDGISWIKPLNRRANALFVELKAIAAIQPYAEYSRGASVKPFWIYMGIGFTLALAIFAALVMPCDYNFFC